jgi:stalled ribosome rescue protein Dom34
MKISNNNSASLPSKGQRNLHKNNAFAQKFKQRIDQSEKLHQATKPKIENGTDIAYKQTAAEFEIAFESFMYNLQFNTVEVDSLTGGGIGEEVFRSQLVDSMIREMRSDNPGHIAKQIYEKIKKDDASNHNQSRIPKIYDE